MANKNIATNQKSGFERNKQVWILKDEEGNIIDSFRIKSVAEREKIKLEKRYIKNIILERDNSLRKNLVKIR